MKAEELLFTLDGELALPLDDVFLLVSCRSTTTFGRSAAPWQEAWRPKEIRTGYVVVREGAPGTHFRAVLKTLDHE